MKAYLAVYCDICETMSVELEVDVGHRPCVDIDLYTCLIDHSLDVIGICIYSLFYSESFVQLQMIFTLNKSI